MARAKKVLVKFDDNWSYGVIEGVFVSNAKEIKKMMGKKIYMGSYAGKHSEVEVVIDDTNTKIVSEDQIFIEQLEKTFKSTTICGLNPFNMYEEREAEDSEDEEE